jgi:hypothetical protein
MTDYSYANAGGESRRFGCWQRAERKPWSILEMGAVLGGFVVFWPLGLAALYLKHRRGEIWKGASDMQGPWTTWKTPRDAADHFNSTFGGGWKRPNWGGQGFSSSGNHAFDEYRKTKIDELEALRRKLDEERAEFDAFLHKLRKSKDAADFERFMAERNAPKTQE